MSWRSTLVLTGSGTTKYPTPFQCAPLTTEHEQQHKAGDKHQEASATMDGEKRNTSKPSSFNIALGPHTRKNKYHGMK